jgi:hypothetical protein
MTELAEKLPRSEVAELLEYRLADIDAKNHADRLIADGALPKKAMENPQKTRADLILGLERAALYYWFGERAVEDIKHNAAQKNDPDASHLKMPPKHRLKRYEYTGFIGVMAVIWEYLGGIVGTATFPGDREKEAGEMPAPFQRFCEGWLEQIDPEGRLPKRKTYRLAIERARAAGAITPSPKRRNPT